MDVRYQKLFSVDFFHTYHQSNRYNGFAIVPDAFTKQIIKSYGLLIRQVNAGVIVLYSEANDRPSLLKKLREKLKLTLYLQPSDTNLINYSDVQTDSVNSPFYLTNVTGSGDHRTTLHDGDYASDVDCVHSITSIGALLDFTDEIPTTIKVETRAGELFFEGSWDDFVNNTLPEDLLLQGFLKVDFNGSGTPQSFYYTSSEVRNIFGIVNVFIGPADSEVSLENIQDSSYSFSLSARSVIWKYNLISRENGAYSDIKIMDGRDPLSTTPVVEVTLPNGEQAYQIESTDPILLQERYEKYLELEMVKNGSVAISQRQKKRMSLPAPDVGRIKMSKTNDTFKAYSEMYIYL